MSHCRSVVEADHFNRLDQRSENIESWATCHESLHMQSTHNSEPALNCSVISLQAYQFLVMVWFCLGFFFVYFLFFILLSCFSHTGT